MAIQSSGQIAMSDIVGEFGGSAPHALSEYYGAATGIPASGQITIGDFYGASNIFFATSTAQFTGSTYVHANGHDVRWTSSGTWSVTLPGGITTARLHAVGAGGGGGGGGHGSSGGGGGGGGYKDTTLTDGGTYTVTVGSGGGSSGCGNESPGGSSSFGTLITAGGGQGGRAGQCGCGCGERGNGGSISGHNTGSSGGNSGQVHDTSCTQYNGGNSSYGGGGGGSSTGWRCGDGPRGYGGSGGGWGGTGGNGANHSGGQQQTGFAYGGGGGAGNYNAGSSGASGIVVLQWSDGIAAP